MTNCWKCGAACDLGTCLNCLRGTHILKDIPKTEIPENAIRSEEER